MRTLWVEARTQSRPLACPRSYAWLRGRAETPAISCVWFHSLSWYKPRCCPLAYLGFPPTPRPHLLLKVSNLSHDSACVLDGLDELAAVLGTAGSEGL